MCDFVTIYLRINLPLFMYKFNCITFYYELMISNYIRCNCIEKNEKSLCVKLENSARLHMDLTSKILLFCIMF